jgi:hypothetical protein
VGGRSPCCDEALAHGNGIWMIIALSAQDLKFADGVVLSSRRRASFFSFVSGSRLRSDRTLFVCGFTSLRS